jgi:hypothetical protein
MRRAIPKIEIIPIGKAFFGCYIASNFAVGFIDDDSSLEGVLLKLWAIFLAPLLAGYGATRLSAHLPALQGFLVTLLGSYVYAEILLNMKAGPPQATADLYVWGAFVIGLFGVWLGLLGRRGALTTQSGADGP